ncbi:MAG: MerR family transcriptional regulator [Anaerolineaceae bacterium]
MFTVKKLSELAGITPRALRYYDRLGLLKPTRVGANGYRYYGEEVLLKLQQILFYRELGLPLERIREIVTRHDFDVEAALENHKTELVRRHARLERLITTVDDTLLHLKGIKEMSEKQLFSAFSEEEQAEMEKEAMQLYDPETVKASNRKWKAYTPEEKQRILEEGNAVYLEMVAAIPQGPASPAAQAGVAHWRRHMDNFWTPDLDQLVALAEHYISEPRFKANFDKVDPRLAEFMGKTVRIYIKQQKKRP